MAYNQEDGRESLMIKEKILNKWIKNDVDEMNITDDDQIQNIFSWKR
jgi:hypothetical protein